MNATKDQKAAAILLPTLFPDLAWIRNVLNADLVILQDDQVFSRKSRVHRGKIRTPDSTHWIHIPILQADRSLPLNRCRLDHTTDWFTPLWRALEYNYRNSIYFDFYEPELKSDLLELKNIGSFLDASKFLFKKIFRYLDLVNDGTQSESIPDSFIYAGEIADETGGSLPDILRHYAINQVLQEAESKHYQRRYPGSIEIKEPLPEYRQHFGGFTPGCCLLDLLFETGPDSWRIFDQLKIPPQKI